MAPNTQESPVIAGSMSPESGLVPSGASLAELLDLVPEPADDPFSESLEFLLDLDHGSMPPTPQGGCPTGPGVGSTRGLPKISGTGNSGTQVTPCTEQPETPPPTALDSRNADTTGSLQELAGGAIAHQGIPTAGIKTADDLKRFIATLDLEKLTYAQKKSLVEVLEAMTRYEAEHMLDRYKPYPKQRDFHQAGASERERLLMAANQVGKTYSAAAEVAMHLTGLYPADWRGKRFTYPPRGLAAGVTAQLVRESIQVLLFGFPAKPLGHGLVPKETIVGEPVMARSITGAYDTVRVKHVSGGESVLYLRAYEQGREKVQAMTLDFVWLDEEPDEDYYTEALTRTNVAQGPVFMTFTPLKGMSGTVARFLLHKQGHVTTMTIDDAEHYTPEERAKIIAQYPAHERDARTKGIPALGSGRVFAIPEENLAVPAFPIPAHWPRLCAVDFGWDHPQGVVWLVWDRDTDTVYVYDCYRAKETLVPAHATMIKSRGSWIPVSWPHDGYQVKDGMYGEQIAQQYRNEGVNMRPEHAQFPESAVLAERKMSRISTEVGIQEMITRMETGRFKVFSHLAEWFEEFRMYHRKDGLLVKVRDDLMSASRVGIMDLRFAEVEVLKHNQIDHERRSDGFI